MPVAKRNSARCEIFILAGGLSTRMGRDKSRIRLGSRTLLGHVRQTAEKTGLRVRVIRRDAVPRCGPMGGIYTALQRSSADCLLFLACDMPFISTELLGSILKKGDAATARSHSKRIAYSVLHKTGRNTQQAIRNTNFSHAIFATDGQRVGFPILLHREPAFPIIARQIEAGEFSLQTLAKKLRAKKLRFPGSQLGNINTPGELTRANGNLPR